MEWLGDFVSEYGVEAMAADDLNTYKPVNDAEPHDRRSPIHRAYRLCVAV